MELWYIAAMVAYFIKGLCGFANTLVFTSILSFQHANANISPIDLILGYPANVILTWQNRKQLQPKVYLPLTALVLSGGLVGALLLKNVDATSIKLLFGLAVIGLGGEMLTRDRANSPVKSSRMMLRLIGLLSGVLCGLFGVGALLAAYVSRVTQGSDSFKANISAVFIADNTFRLFLYTYLHLLTWETLQMSLTLIPCALVGLFLGIRCCHFLNETKIRKLTALLLILSGISLIGRNM